MTCEKHENWHAVCHKCAHQELLDAQEGFADYKYRSEVLEKERDEARARVAELEAHVEHQQAHQKLLAAEVERLKAQAEHFQQAYRESVESRLAAQEKAEKLELLWKAEMEHALTITERERDEARAKVAVLEKGYSPEVAAALRAENSALRARVAGLEWDRETACENTPTKGCECPGCCTARERAERGEA